MNIFQRLLHVIKEVSDANYGKWESISDSMAQVFGSRFGRSKSEVLELYKNLVYACITVTAENVARYQPILKSGEKQLESHDLLRLLKFPGHGMTQYELFEAIITYRKLVGEVFLYFGTGELSGKPKSITLLNPARMKIAVNESTGEVVGYTYRAYDGTEIPFTLEEIYHYKTFNPNNRYRGLGTVEAALLYVDTENQTSEFQNYYISNQASPSGILTISSEDGKVSKEAYEKTVKLWKEKYAGVKNSGKTLILRQADAKFEKLGLSIEDVNLPDLSKLNEHKIRTMFRVPMILLGETDSTGLGRANAEAAEYIFASYVVDPEQDRIDDMLSQILLRFWKQELTVTHVSQIPLNEEQLLQKYDKAVGRWMTVNEIRLEQGKEPIKGGDQLYVNFNQTPLTQPAQKTIKIVKKSTEQEVYFEKLDQIEARTSRGYVREHIAYLDSQQDRIVAALQTLTGEKKSVKKAVDFIFDQFDLGSDVLLASLVSQLLNLMQNSGDLTLSYQGFPDLDFLLTQATREAVFRVSEREIKGFDEQTKLKLEKTLAAGLTEKENLAQLTKRVEEVYVDTKGYRAKRIANTESHRVSNESVSMVFQQIGIKRMKWVANPSACEFCKAMDGTIIDVGTTFIPKGASVRGVDGNDYLNDYIDVKYADLHPDCQCHLEGVPD